MCAVTGYKGLDLEVDLIPNESIAKEAQHRFMRSRQPGGDEGGNRTGSQEIFDETVHHPMPDALAGITKIRFEGRNNLYSTRHLS